MMWDTEQAVLWLRRLISVAILLQSLELLQIRHVYGSSGIWRWQIVRDELVTFPRPLRWFFDFLLNDQNFPFLLLMRLAVAGIALFLPWGVFFWVLLVSTLLVALRWRGTFNGGSDYMTLVVLMGACGGTATWLAYVAIQICLSYFVAGIVKLKAPNWRKGKALEGFLGPTNYDVPLRLQRLRKVPGAAWAASWGLMVFECSFPLALVSRELCGFYLATAFLFHLGNVYAFGLNRFLWAWTAGYPALYWLSSWLAASRG